MSITLRSFFIFFLLSCHSQNHTLSIDQIVLQDSSIEVGAAQIQAYLPLLNDKRIGIIANQTSVINDVHLVDTLINLGQNIKCVFSPEHGFRGKADAGEHIKSDIDVLTGIPIVSLYGATKKPSKDQLKNIDILIFDIQDVGARFYTYISTLHYIIEAAAENNIPLIILDRPNPNGHYVDGPVLKSAFHSFVGMHTVPIVHGLTVAEYALMINGEKWTNADNEAEIHVVKCQNYGHSAKYELPIPPSPNLRSSDAIRYYPTICLLEGTVISEGRGTETPFEIIGHPLLPDSLYTDVFKPFPCLGSKNPKLNGQICNGISLKKLKGFENQINLELLIQLYNDYQGEDFFIIKNNWFDMLAGSNELREQITIGKSANEIRQSWQKDLNAFKVTREKYLLYP